MKDYPDKIHAKHAVFVKNMMLSRCIYLQGGPTDRSVASLSEGHLSLTHSTFPRVQNSIPVNPHHHYITEASANPYHSYVTEAPQTLTIPTFAGLKKGYMISVGYKSKRRLLNPDYYSLFPGHDFRSGCLSYSDIPPKPPVEGNEKQTFRRPSSCSSVR